MSMKKYYIDIYCKIVFVILFIITIGNVLQATILPNTEESNVIFRALDTYNIPESPTIAVEMGNGKWEMWEMGK